MVDWDLDSQSITSYEIEDGDGVEFHEPMYPETDVKEFVQKLKNKVKDGHYSHFLLNIIDELAGKRLINDVPQEKAE